MSKGSHPQGYYVASKSVPPGRWYRLVRHFSDAEQKAFTIAVTIPDPGHGRIRRDEGFTPTDNDTAI